MNEAKHTPGPWTVDGPPWNQIVWSDAENRVCFLAHTNGLDDERDIATGRLIAAAPDMLAALKGAELQLRSHKIDCRELDEIRAAIAKAEGRSS